MADPVHFDEATKAWWFWDETWADRVGPYPDEETARRRCADYAVYLDTGVDPHGKTD